MKCFRREQQSGYKTSKKRLVHPLLKAHERFPRRRNTSLNQTSNSPATTAPPSPSSGASPSPVKATLVTQLNNSNQPETVLVPSNNSFKQRKYKHRRVGSGCGISSSPRSSPNRERRVTFFVLLVVLFCCILLSFKLKTLNVFSERGNSSAVH